MEVIRLEDLKQWRAARIARGNCNFDDMVALGAFIERVEKMEVEDEQTIDAVARKQKAGRSREEI